MSAKYPVMPWNATPPLHKAHQSQVINLLFLANLKSTLHFSLLMEKRTNLEYNGIKLLPSSSAVAMRPAEMMCNGRTFVSTCQQDPPTNPSLAPAFQVASGFKICRKVSDVNFINVPASVFFATTGAGEILLH